MIPLFHLDPLLAMFALLWLLGSVAAVTLAALIEPVTRSTRLRRMGWRALRLLCGVSALVALVGLYIAL